MDGLVYILKESLRIEESLASDCEKVDAFLSDNNKVKKFLKDNSAHVKASNLASYEIEQLIDAFHEIQSNISDFDDKEEIEDYLDDLEDTIGDDCDEDLVPVVAGMYLLLFKYVTGKHLLRDESSFKTRLTCDLGRLSIAAADGSKIKAYLKTKGIAADDTLVSKIQSICKDIIDSVDSWDFVDIEYDDIDEIRDDYNDKYDEESVQYTLDMWKSLNTDKKTQRIFKIN